MAGGGHCHMGLKLNSIFHVYLVKLSLYSTATQNYWRWDFALGQPPNSKIRVGNTNMLVCKNAKICVTPTRNIKFGLPPTQTPNASQWNIVWVGSPGIGSHVGHVHFMFFVLISFAFGSQRKPSFQWNMGFIHQFNITVINHNKRC